MHLTLRAKDGGSTSVNVVLANKLLRSKHWRIRKFESGDKFNPHLTEAQRAKRRAQMRYRRNARRIRREAAAAVTAQPVVEETPQSDEA